MTVSPSAVLKTALTAAVLHGVFVVGLPALIVRRTAGRASRSRGSE